MTSETGEGRFLHQIGPKMVMLIQNYSFGQVGHKLVKKLHQFGQRIYITNLSKIDQILPTWSSWSKVGKISPTWPSW